MEAGAVVLVVLLFGVWLVVRGAMKGYFDRKNHERDELL